jgi:parallel beta-helix repeat protein
MISYYYSKCRGSALIFVVIISILGLLLIAEAGAATLTVDDSGVRDHIKIQDAINNVSTADTIFFSSIALEEAVDNTALNFTSGGNASWFGQDNVSYFGGDAAHSGRISHNQNTWIQTNVTDIGMLSFFWKVSSESHYDVLEFYIDGMLIGRISGEVNWTKKSYSIGSGNHSLKWMYKNLNINQFWNGIYLTSSSNNTINGNNASNNRWLGGISLDFSINSMLTNNSMNGNGYNFQLAGSSISHFNNQIDTTNLVDGKPIYYIKGAANTVYDSSTNAGTYFCINCVNVTL